MSDNATPAKVRLTDGLGPPLEDALKRAYYYTEAGEWRWPEVDEWDRWHAVAKVAAAQVEAERERIFAHIRSAMGHAEAGLVERHRPANAKLTCPPRGQRE